MVTRARTARPQIAGPRTPVVHQTRSEAHKLLDLGAALREAHRTLDPQQLGQLSHEQHRVIAAFARQAGDQARRAGHPPSETVRHEVEQILHTVLADPEFADQCAKGYLVKAPPTTVDFSVLAPDATPAAVSRPSAAAKPAAEGPKNRTATGTSALTTKTAASTGCGSTADPSRCTLARRSCCAPATSTRSSRSP